jgi:hypothetical protein
MTIFVVVVTVCSYIADSFIAVAVLIAVAVVFAADVCYSFYHTIINIIYHIVVCTIFKKNNIST